jgi:hypothetical protein
MGAKIGVQFKDAEDFFNSLMLNLLDFEQCNMKSQTDCLAHC